MNKIVLNNNVYLAPGGAKLIDNYRPDKMSLWLDLMPRLLRVSSMHAYDPKSSFAHKIIGLSNHNNHRGKTSSKPTKYRTNSTNKTKLADLKLLQKNSRSALTKSFSTKPLNGFNNSSSTNILGVQNMSTSNITIPQHMYTSITPHSFFTFYLTLVIGLSLLCLNLVAFLVFCIFKSYISAKRSSSNKNICLAKSDPRFQEELGGSEHKCHNSSDSNFSNRYTKTYCKTSEISKEIKVNNEKLKKQKAKESFASLNNANDLTFNNVVELLDNDKSSANSLTTLQLANSILPSHNNSNNNNNSNSNTNFPRSLHQRQRSQREDWTNDHHPANLHKNKPREFSVRFLEATSSPNDHGHEGFCSKENRRDGRKVNQDGLLTIPSFATFNQSTV
ncbi:hypothetical protein HELRODRAFT_179233 [Helobdella robusta]|uniref:Uncharacterized protein n=1 Tax=Helobdella robusta TaxID=6412 RepID=T1FEE5_HELRO|nr:hypothetical protein HELRODRAFT_179233 [Helobdella robusta]ESN95465.1 hypothetical protein HELRODRAFT_179233 [Helobdella robusta]